MKHRTALAASALALLIASPVFAQGALVGVDALDERIDDIQEDVTDDLNRTKTRDRLSNQYAQGWTGSVALGFSATSGNTDTADLDLAGRFRYGSGLWNHTLGFAAEFAEDNDVRNKEEVYATYDVNRYFSENAYIFGLASARYDNFDANKIDGFLGFGPGYRVINQPNQTWRVQAGPGVRYVEEQDGSNTTETAGIASSRYFYGLTDTVSTSMDTDVIFSEEDTIVSNDLGVNFKVSNALSTRISYRTEWDSDPQAGFENADNTLGVSLIYGF
ncbi:DUF481 domain-containing protein [Marinovum sp.]|uniref:DUF481 domain-containing protein n=1 Tax=Marinovum sp. TaxID=2024839 RepID=UPI002B26C5DA|nr:DUF481 domain-containing protein [Marinovum sp.]